MSSLLASGTFKQTDAIAATNQTAQTVITDGVNSSDAGAHWTSGAVRISTVAVPASLAQERVIIGWTLRFAVSFMKFVDFTQGGSPSSWATTGDLWAGILVDDLADNTGGVLLSGQRRQGGASFPRDLSTFTKVWTGATDGIKQAPNADKIDDTLALPVGTTFLLPTPVTIPPGSQVQMVLILTPTLGAGILLLVTSCNYAILYNAQASGFDPDKRG